MAQIDILWMLLCSALVMLMQAGFTCLEAGLVRAKNSINVAIKNVTDFAVTVLLFWAFGFALMFGPILGDGTSTWFLNVNGDIMPMFIFQVMFCGAATTLIAGALAERTRFSSYLCIAVLVAGLIYPIFGHWAWAGIMAGEEQGWLQAMGFRDFAGSTVVHALGGWVALAAILIIGPRLGRFDQHSVPIQGHNIPMAALGVMLLWIGWLGFNGGSTLAFSNDVPLILINTVLAGAAGGMFALLFYWYWKGVADVMYALNGIIAGLVSITASADIMSPLYASLIGLVSGALCIVGTKALEYWKIDDVIGVVPAHLIPGVWGTLAVALFGNIEAFAGLTRWQQFEVQLLGVVVCALWAFGMAWVLLSLLNRIMPLRVSEAAEMQGLNMAEHGASTEVSELLLSMAKQQQSGDFSKPIAATPYTDTGQIAEQYNHVMQTVTIQENDLRDANAELEMQAEELTASEEELQAQQEELRLSNDELINKNNRVEAQKKDLQASTKSLAQQAEKLRQASQYKSDFLSNMSHELRTPLNSLLILAEMLAKNKDGNLSDKQIEFAQTIQASGIDLLGLVNNILDLAKIEAGKLELSLQYFPLQEISQAMQREFKHTAQEQGISFRLTQSQDLPNQLFSDITRIKQVLKNLLSNAFKFTSQGEVALHISRVDAERIQFAISDSGIGIAADKLNDIFETFQQEDGSTSRKYGGTGLGLSICRELGQLLAGSISVQSEQGKGSTFSLIIPIHLSEPVSQQSLINTAPSNTVGIVDPALNPDIAAPIHNDDHNTMPACQHTILIVEDDITQLQSLTRLLAADNVGILTASNGEDTLALLRREHIHCMILDLGLPGISGQQVLESIQAEAGAINQGHSLPIIVYTGRDLSEQQTESLQVLSNSIILKSNHSPKRLMAETSLFLHRIEENHLCDTDQLIDKQALIDELHADVDISGKTVLLVDDDIRNIFSLSSFLESYNVLVHTARNGIEALAALELHGHAIDLILMDIMMPDMDGYEATKKIRQIHAHNKLPIIALTAKAMIGDREDCIAAGASDYITKPVDTDKLISLMRVWLHE